MYTTLPEIRSFKLLDIPNTEDDELKVWPLAICAVLLAVGVYVTLRIIEGSVSIWWFVGIQAAIYSFAFVMWRIQRYGGFWWNVQQTRRGFRVVLKPKDRK